MAAARAGSLEAANALLDTGARVDAIEFTPRPVGPDVGRGGTGVRQ